VGGSSVSLRSRTAVLRHRAEPVGGGTRWFRLHPASTRRSADKSDPTGDCGGHRGHRARAGPDPGDRRAARIVQAATAGIVLTRSGDTLPCRGCPTTACWPPALRSSLPRWPSWPMPTPASPSLPPRGRPTTATVTSGWSGSARWIAPARPWTTFVPRCSSPRRETCGERSRLDLRLLGLLVEGAPHISAIAAALGVDKRTVSDALRASLAALETPDPTAATARGPHWAAHPPTTGHSHLIDNTASGHDDQRRFVRRARRVGVASFDHHFDHHLTLFGAVRGRSWRFRIPPDVQERTSTNDQGPVAEGWGSRGRRFKSCPPDGKPQVRSRPRRNLERSLTVSWGDLPP
jgi:hypothetical protein